MDLTVLSTPFYFATMEAERRWLRRRPDSTDPASPDRGRYERNDTRANLTMGTASLVIPLITHRIRRHVEWGRGRAVRPILVGSALAAAMHVGSELVARRATRRDDAAARLRAETWAGRSALAAMSGIGVVATATWASKMSPQRIFQRSGRDLGAGWKPLAAAVVGWDFIYYWNHRLMHESRFMWAIHVVHHSSERYNLSVALRQPVADALGIFIPYGLMCYFGISPGHIETARGINLLYQYWVHTETIGRLGPVESVMNTASHHRVHHGSNRQYLDRNHGGILIIWDKLFGTFEPEVAPVVYGLTKNVNSFNPVTIAVNEYQLMANDVVAARSWSDRLGHVLRGPGWNQPASGPVGPERSTSSSFKRGTPDLPFDRPTLPA